MFQLFKRKKKEAVMPSPKLKAPKGFIAVTRVYTKGKSTAVIEQQVILAKDAVCHMRPRKKLNGQRSLIVTKSRVYLNLKETVTELTKLLA